MKGKDIRTVDAIIKEYGMSQGVSTPVGNQQSGQTAKASAANRTNTSAITKPSQSPSTQQKANIDAPDPAEPKQPVVAKAKELEKDFEFPDEKGNVVKVVSPVGQGKNKDAVVVQNQKNKEFYTLQPDDKISLPQVSADELKEKINLDRIIKRKHKLKKKIKHLLRAQKHVQQGEPVFEINFNSKELAKGALNAKIACGFEAETVWPNLGEGADSEDTDWLDDLYWNRVSDLIYDQEGARSLERVEEAYREWLQEEIVYDIESDVVLELVNDRKEDEAYIDDFVSDKIDMDEVEEYKAEKLERLEIDDMQDELEEYSDWDMDAWAREYVEMEKDDEFVEWLEEQIRDNGEAWDDAWQRAQDEYDMDDWVRREHGGSWYSLLGDYDIYLYNEDGEGGGVDAVASMLEDWASNNSRSNDVRAGGYHSGQGVDNTYWRVEDDSSIEGDGAKAEIISPVYDSPAEMLKEMKSLFEYMDSNDAETNSSTGLHITMSFPDEGVEKANRLKMAVLLGDKYVLKQFGREQNSYTKSQQETLQKYVKNLQTNIKDQKSLDALEEILLGGISAGKFSSINFKDAENQAGNNLIEFRVAGGEDYHLMSDKVMKAVIRYAAVMQAGHDPEAYRKDYIKALFKMIAGKDTVSGDVVKRAQTMVDPESINDKVLAAFQNVASEKHYTDAIEALSNAYMQLKDAQAKRNSNPQQELQFEDEESDWRRDMIVAQKYFVRAFAMLASDVASGANRAKPTAAVIASLRQALKDFNMTPKILWDELQQSEFYTRFPGQVHDKSEKFASAVNSLLKKQDAKALEPAFTVKFNPGTQRMFMPGPIADAVNTASGNNIFGRDDDAGQLPAQFTPKMFKVIDDSEYSNVREARWDFETALEQHNQQLEIIQSFKDSIKQNPEKADDYKEAMAHRLADVEKLKKQMEPSQKAMDAFKSKYGFVPPSVRSRSKTTGNEWKLVSIDDLSWLSSNHNIKFTTTESKMNTFEKFTNLPLIKQLALLENIDSNKLNEAWSKKKKVNEEWYDVYRDYKGMGYSDAAARAEANKAYPDEASGNQSYQSRPTQKPELQYYMFYDVPKDLEQDAVKYWGIKKLKSGKFAIPVYNTSGRNTSIKIQDANKEFGPGKKWAPKKTNETIEAEQDMAALLTAYGTPKKKKKKKAKVKEGAVPNNDSDRKIKQLLNKPMLASDLRAQMEAYFVIPDPSMIHAFRQARSAGGDQADLRSIFKGFISHKAHPALKKKVGIKESVLKEDDRDQERFNFIIDKLKQHPEFIQRVYRFIKTDAKNSERVHPQDFLTPDRTAPEADYNYKGVLPEFVKAIMNTDGDFDDIENFLATYGKVSYVNTKVLMADGSSTWDQWLQGSEKVSVQFITELYDNLFNVALNIEGSNRGPGEVGLALLAPNITFASVGDLMIDGEEVEVKGEKSSGGGRLKNSNADYGQPNLDAVYDKFNITPEDRPQRLPSANAGSRPGTHFLDIATQLDQLAAGAGKAYINELFTATFKYGDKQMINYIITNYAGMDRADASTLAQEISYSSYANILKGKGFSKFLFLKAPGKKSLAFDVDDYKNHLDKFKLGSLDWGDKMNGPAVQVSMR